MRTTDKLIMCKKCGKAGFAWARSKRTGNWYLAETSFPNVPYEVFSWKPHRCNGQQEEIKPEPHEQEELERETEKQDAQLVTKLEEMTVDELRKEARRYGHKGAGVLALKKKELIALISGSGSLPENVTINKTEKVMAEPTPDTPSEPVNTGDFSKVIEQELKRWAEEAKGWVDTRVADLFKTASTDLRAAIKDAAKVAVFEMRKDVEAKIQEAVDRATKNTRTIEVKNIDTGKAVNVGRQHKQFETLLRYLSLRLNTVLVGPAGSGKTMVAEKAAEALGYQFYPQSVGAQTTKSDLLGYMDANGRYVSSILRQAMDFARENPNSGAIYLLDEFDAGNANVTLALNALLANAYLSYPDGVVSRPENFLVIASANTYGRGADAQYIGRNKMDDATLDRFAVIDWKYDEEFELVLASDKKWTKHVQSLRKAAMDLKERVVISPRASIFGSSMVEAGMSYDEVEHAVIWKGVSDDAVKKIKANAR